MEARSDVLALVMPNDTNVALLLRLADGRRAAYSGAGPSRERAPVVSESGAKPYRDWSAKRRLCLCRNKLDLILAQSVVESESDASELRLIKEERSSTEKCLQICAQLSDHNQSDPACSQKQRQF